eukprot:TRINITY_DN10184_c0_g1_i2.p1 TRINITY_DN10184_c0_g1~~TRINITY_DN10184_c0_g1_i2.p1  ORF type:complete len:1582 (+),score=248.00 TRINITY_DN10184_c0_g1_i2:51-4796(+)
MDRNADILAWLNERKTATLEFDDGCTFEGFSFGAPISVAGEVVFNTGMVGYPESLTDPSYAGQILVITFPLVGNYGVPNDDKDSLGLARHFESDRIHVKAVVISDYSFVSSHYTATRSLSAWLTSQGVPGIYGVDTRRITKLIRQRGALLGKVLVEGSTKSGELPWNDPNTRNLAAEVCRPERQVFLPPAKDSNAWEVCESLPESIAKEGGGSQLHILAVDCGIKNNIIRYLVNACRVKLTVVPWDYDFSGDQFDGLFLSNGPGDPTQCSKTIEHVRKVMQRTPAVPIFGICLGNQILALAAGAKTFKMRFGNRGMNQPCVDLRTSRCYITPQNHGFAVDPKTLPTEWMPLMVNANDGTNEGIIHRNKPWFSVQFHPEACGGPTDTSFLFQSFIQSVAEPSATAVTTIPYSLPEIRRKVLVLGSGGITIGQAGEFDYSGSQALKALRENGVQSVLLNPNIATIQTSKGLADKVYFLPVTLEFATKVIQRERPDGILCSFGGQTALNCAIRLDEEGVLKKYGVQVLGTPISAIIMTEDREIFAKAVADCGYKVAESACCSSVQEAVDTAKEIGFPVLVRAAFACGGLGSGFANNEREVQTLVETALVHSPQVIIDKSLKGWKELEYEVVRDRNDNCITVCNMENLDPMGVHTGDSIVIAPSQTLTNDEYFALRECALKVVRHLGVVGECNIQYGVDPKSREFRIIEVNARLSRSSALASKATGYPLAYVAAKLALGADLVQLRNSVTKCTTACFEPSLDYIVAKVPRWDLQKFATVDQNIGSCMKSVGEVMSIGRTFEEVIQKALRMVDESSLGFDGQRFDQELNRRGDMKCAIDSVRAELETPTPMRIWSVAKAFSLGMDIEEVHKLTNIDRWFLAKLHNIHELGSVMRTQTYTDLSLNPALLREAKRRGFSDKQIAESLRPEISPQQCPAHDISMERFCGAEVYNGGRILPSHVRYLRRSIGLRPVVKQIDTLAAEFPADTNYLYLTYHGDDDDVGLAGAIRDNGSDTASTLDSWTQGGHSTTRLDDPPTSALQSAKPKELVSRSHSKDTGDAASKRVIVLGCGPYRIGSSVEFDWCSVSCLRTLRSMGHKAIVINCNPETVSTDYDESDRLYFEELSHESVMDIVELECPQGVVVSVGGQTPNNLAMGLSKCGVKILGTSVEAIDTCENRFKFSKLCDAQRIDQPEWSQFTTVEEAFQFCRLVGYPALVRPSYVLSGAAMRVVSTDEELELFLGNAAVVSREYPVVISKYIVGAKEVELDAVAHNGEIVNYAIAEHVENAGVHSGDATLLLPAQKLFVETHRRVKKIGQKICAALNISGPVNIQFMCKENEVKVIETNLRASRSLPFISKTYDVNFIDIATRIMLGAHVNKAVIQPIDLDHVSCKVPMFSFARLKNSDPRLGVEMQSTGEVASFGFNQHEAFLKGMIAAGFKLPSRNVLVSLGPSHSKIEIIQSVQLLAQMGFQIYATKSTCEFLKGQEGLQSVVMVYKPLVKREPNVQTLLQAGKLDLVINVPDSMDSHGVTDGFELRRMAVDSGTSLITDIKLAVLTVQSLHRKWVRESEGREFFSIKTWQEYVEGR